jgi:large conductance mechanosensitive channel
MIKEFRNFILRGNVVDLAVALVMGIVFSAAVTSLVDNILTPLIAMVFGEPDFGGLSFTINDAEFRYGLFLNALFTLVATGAAVFFFVVKPLNVLAERRKAGEEPEPATVPADIELLTEIRDLLRSQSTT